MLVRSWDFWAHDCQIPPAAGWRVWLFLGGRGAGKTRAGAEFVNALAHERKAMRIGLIGATLHEARSVMVEGKSGLLNPFNPAMRPHYARSARRLTWPGGAVAEIVSAAPRMLRGPQFDLIWADEFAKWHHADETFDMAQMALRLGKQPRMVVTTTPRRLPALQRLIADRATATTRARTGANAAHLAPGFIADLERRYGGTALGRQEIGGEMLEDDETALWKRAWIDRSRVSEAPELARVIVAVDPPVSAGPRADACGIIVAGRDATGQVFVLADRTVRGLSPAGWAACVKRAVDAFEADAIIVESNQGGDLLKDVLDKAGCAGMRITKVHAGQSKRVRADPVAVLYEQGKVSHVGNLSALEDEMCVFGGVDAGSASPDRVDALVWAVNALTPRGKGPGVRDLG